ncbi:MAG: hypothetical protein GY845_25640 [Planctomycetes bacterium]|nr:hypothetical protein [Planctomycetota bacterium]
MSRYRKISDFAPVVAPLEDDDLFLIGRGDDNFSVSRETLVEDIGARELIAYLLLNIEDWAAYYATSPTIYALDRLLYDDVSYLNLTGAYTATAPDLDATNWQISSVMGRNSQNTLYMGYDEFTDGGIRFEINADGIAEIRKRDSGLWQLASLKIAEESLFVGLGMSIAKAGRHLTTEDSSGTFSFFAYNCFDGEVSTTDSLIPYFYEFQAEEPVESDDSSEILSTSFSFIITATEHEIIRKVYIKTGGSVINEPIRVRVYESSDDTGDLIFDREFAADNFSPINTEVFIFINGFLEFLQGQDYFFKLESDDNISLKTNAAQTRPWVSVDRSLMRNDDMLQTNQWLTGDDFDYRQWKIDDREIYVCNEEGAQTGTFAGNSDKWDALVTAMDENSSHNEIPVNKTAHVKEYHQMLVHGGITIDGDLIVDGDLCLI